MIRLFLVFIVIYVAFTAISLNYAKAFRVKNSVISFIEEKQITDLNAFFSKGNDKYRSELNNILSSFNYNKTCSDGNGKIDTGPGGPQAYCYNGIIVEETDRTSDVITYAVYTYAGWNLRSLNMILALGGRDQNSEAVIGGSWQISGEATVKLRKAPGNSNNPITPVTGCNQRYPFSTGSACEIARESYPNTTRCVNQWVNNKSCWGFEYN